MRNTHIATRLIAGISLLFFVTQSVWASYPFVAEDPASPILSFESDALPASLQPGSGSVVELTSRHYLNGTQSLRWQWNGASDLFFNRKIPFVSNQKAYQQLKRGALSVFSFWVYSEKALPDAKLRVEFGQADCGFDFGLNFTGWRTCAVAFSRDMDGKPREGMHGLRIKAPANVPSGELFIDRIILASVDDIRYQWPDPQVPFVQGTGFTSMEITPIPDAASDTPDERAAVDRLETQFETEYLLEAPASSNEVESVLSKFNDLEITMQDGVIRGRHVLFSRNELRDRQDSVYPRELTKQDEFLMSQYTELRETTDLMQRIGQIYRSLSSENKDALRLREIFMLMSRHLLDQGWQDGSALYTTHHFGYASRGWYVAVFLMRDELAREGILDPVVRSLIWYMREKVDFAKMKFDPSEGTDLDYVNTIAKSHLMTVLSMPDGPAKTALVRKYSNYFSDLLAADTRGTLGGIKADGTAFHHGGNYPGYSFPAYRSASTLCRLLNGTPFAIRADALQNLNKALTAAAIYSNPETGIGLCGRHPFGESSVESLAETFQDLEACGYPVELDRQHMPDGHWSFNYGCFGIHRWNGKMVTFKGYNKYVWSSEIYTRDNRYGRYQSHGSVQIMNRGGRTASGWVQDGWDWNRLPGATTIHLPLDLLDNPKKGTMMARSDTRFSGSSNLGGRYGIFAADIKTPNFKNFYPSFVARKSMFCFDNRIICLGAGIKNGTENYPTETILFQHQWKEGKTPVWMDSSEPVTNLPYTAKSSDGSWLVDAHGNGYVVAGGDPVRLSISTQNSRNEKTKQPTKGDFATAWIDHGDAPQKALYEYAILLDGTPENTAAFAAAPPYRVLCNNPQLQAVCDNESGVTGYAFFEGASEPVDDLILYTDKPCLIMTQESKDGELTLSVNNADLRIIGADSSYTTDEASRPGWVDIILKGTWELAQPNEKITLKDRDGNTFISVSIHHAIPVEFAMKR